jgi:ribose transport system ATP-binding protein
LRIGSFASPERRYFISWKRERHHALNAFARYGIGIDLDSRIGDLAPVDRAIVAIVRAIEEIRGWGRNLQGGILILDEPTVFLPRADVERVFELVREIAAGGASVVFVSHDIEEVQQITDRVTVLRDGRHVGTLDPRRVDSAEIVELILGRQLNTYASGSEAHADNAPIAKVFSLQGDRLEGLSLDLHLGEVVGLTGLAGSGFEVPLYLLFGAGFVDSGQLTIGSRSIDLRRMTPMRALELGIVLIPADRARDGAAGSLPVIDNLALPVLDTYFNGLFLRRKKMARDAATLMNAFDVRPRDPELLYSQLSGGNQQKVLLAKWLRMKPRLLLLDEPTQGVDVGARQDIFRMIREGAANEMAVLLASADYEQLAVVCDRVLVFSRGRVASSLSGKDLTKEHIAERCYQTEARPES